MLVWPSGENGQSSNSKMANRATHQLLDWSFGAGFIGPHYFPPFPHFNEARGVWVRVHFPLFLPQPVPGVAPSPASTIRYLPCTAPTPRPREPRPLFDDYAECGLAWKQIPLGPRGMVVDEGAPRKIRVWGSSDRMEGSGARQAADVKPILKSSLTKKSCLRSRDTTLEFHHSRPFRQ